MGPEHHRRAHECRSTLESSQAGVQAHVMTLQDLSQSPPGYLDRDLSRAVSVRRRGRLPHHDGCLIHTGICQRSSGSTLSLKSMQTRFLCASGLWAVCSKMNQVMSPNHSLPTLCKLCRRCAPEPRHPACRGPKEHQLHVAVVGHGLLGRNWQLPDWAPLLGRLGSC